MLYTPYPDFQRCAKVLATYELRNQIIQVVDLMEVLHQTDKAKEHPDKRIVQMWQGYEAQLCQYGLIMLEELERRRASISRAVVVRLHWHLECAAEGDFEMSLPPWIGDESVHRSHRSALIAKSYYYADVFESEPDDLPLVWPE